MLDTAQLKQKLRKAERALAVARAREALIPYARLAEPHPDDPEDSNLSLYEVAAHNLALAQLLQRVERGTARRVIITMPPRHGKSRLGSQIFGAWFMGRNPRREFICAAYNQTLADEFGDATRQILTSAAHEQAFPDCQLRKDKRSVNDMVTTRRGRIRFIGLEGGLTGKGADLMVIDDPIPNMEVAESQHQRDKLWANFLSAAYTRMQPGGRIIIIITRWHEDDIVGRIDNPEYLSPERAKEWIRFDLPAIAGEDDALGRKPGEALWPAWYPLEELEAIRDTVGPRIWNSLYQQKPTPPDGTLFKRQHIRYYRRDQLPENLRIYITSDHAISNAENRDASVYLVGGISENGDLYILDCWWEREGDLDVQMDQMMAYGAKYKPLFWFAERDKVTKSIGPLLRKRQLAARTYFTMESPVPTTDKKMRAQPIQALMAMGKVFFPANAPWLMKATDELLKFPYAPHDDFVDALGMFGRALDMEMSAAKIRPGNDNAMGKRGIPATPQSPGSWQWYRQQRYYSERKLRRMNAAKGY